MPNIIKQGVDCWIEANSIIDVRTGNSLNVVGYTVHAAARARYERRVLGRRIYQYRMMQPVIAEWSDTPTGTQGTAIVGTNIVNGVQLTDQVQLHVTPTQTWTWRCPLVAIQAELTDPVTGYVARIIDEIYEINFDALPQTWP